MNRSVNSNDILNRLIKNCEYYDFSEKQSLEVINEKLSKPISRSTYYYYKKKLYQDEIFQSLKKSIYKSNLLKSLMLYMDDETGDSDGYEINPLISEQFQDKRDVFCITDEQFDKNSRLYNKTKSNFCICDNHNDRFRSNLTRVNGLPKNILLRRSIYDVINRRQINVKHALIAPITTLIGEKNYLNRINQF